MKIKKLHKKYEIKVNEGPSYHLYLVELDETCFDLNEIK